jgi:hypothetical protein
MPLDLPAILGRDASGEVIEVGAGVTAFKVGDKVLGRVTGGYAEQVVASVDAWAKLPAKLDLADASALPLVLLTTARREPEASVTMLAVTPRPAVLMAFSRSVSVFTPLPVAIVVAVPPAGVMVMLPAGKSVAEVATALDE